MTLVDAEESSGVNALLTDARVVNKEKVLHSVDSSSWVTVDVKLPNSLI